MTEESKDIRAVISASAKTVMCNKPGEELIRVSRGKYIKSDEAKDRLFFLQMKYSRCIYSHETALFLHGYIDEPDTFYVTCPQGYNVLSLKEEGAVITKVIPENYCADIIDHQTAYGNTIRVYSIERTLCDMLRGKRADNPLINCAMKKYIAQKGRDLDALCEVAERMRVGPKVRHYLDVLL